MSTPSNPMFRNPKVMQVMIEDRKRLIDSKITFPSCRGLAKDSLLQTCWGLDFDYEWPTVHDLSSGFIYHSIIGSLFWLYCYTLWIRDKLWGKRPRHPDHIWMQVPMGTWVRYWPAVILPLNHSLIFSSLLNQSLSFLIVSQMQEFTFIT